MMDKLPRPVPHWQAVKYLCTDYSVEIHKYPAVGQKVNTDNEQAAHFCNKIYSVSENILLDNFAKVPSLHKNNTVQHH